MPPRDRAVRIPTNLGVIMRVKIDEAWRDDQPVSIDSFFCEAGGTPPDLGDLAVFNPQIAAIARYPSSVDDCPTLNANIEFRHLVGPPFAGVVRLLIQARILIYQPFAKAFPISITVG